MNYYIFLLLISLQGIQAQEYLVVLEPRYNTKIAAELTSTVLGINKDMGDSFAEGELLVKLDDTVFLANFEKAESAFQKALVEAEVTRRLFDDKSASLFDLKTAEAGLAQANAEFWQAKHFLDMTTLRAPYSGKVVKVTSELYELVQPGKEIIHYIDDAKLYARFLAPVELLSDLKVGRKVTIKLEGIPKMIVASITRVAPMIDAVSSTIKVEAEIDNSLGYLTAGMVGTLKVNHLKKEKEPNMPPVVGNEGLPSETLGND